MTTAAVQAVEYRFVRVEAAPRREGWWRVVKQEDTALWFGAGWWLASVEYDSMEAACKAAETVVPLLERLWDLRMQTMDANQAVVNTAMQLASTRVDGCRYRSDGSDDR